MIDPYLSLAKTDSFYKEVVFLQGFFFKLASTPYAEITLSSVKGMIGSVWGFGFLSHQPYGYAKDDWLFLFEKHMPCVLTLKKEGHFEGLSLKEALFEVIMGDFEHMKQYDRGLTHLVGGFDLARDLWSSSSFFSALRKVLSHRMSTAWREVSGAPALSVYASTALSVVYIRSLWVFTQDHTEDLAATMVSVNEGLGLLGANFKNGFRACHDEEEA